MPWTINYIFVLIGTFLIAIVGTPLVRSLAFRVGAVDNPNARRINKKPMPSAGGLAIFLAFVLATLVFMPMIIQKDVWHISYFRYILPVAVGGAIVVLTGFIDDIFELKPLPKMLGIVIGAVIVWAFTDFRFDSFKIPFGGPVIQFGPVLTLILTVLWIAAITNAINLIDGLDGLVGGVSIISLMTTHRGAVLVVYAIATLFSLIALLLNVSSRLGGILLLLSLLLGMEILIEGLEIWGIGRTPLFNFLKFIGNSNYRQAIMLKWKQGRKK